MTTALTVYLASAAATTITTADQLYTTSGTPTTTQSYSKIGNNVTGYGEIESQANNANTWAASGSIGSPTGKGFLLDVTTLESQQIVSGNWTPSVRLNAAQGSGAPQAGTLVGDIYMRAYKYSGGTYTLIVTCSLTAQTLNTTFTTYTLTAASGSTTNFSTGDKLYVDIWFNCTTNTNAVAAQGVRLNRLSTDTTTKTGDTNAQFVSPGYQSSVTNNSMSSTDSLTATDSLLVTDSDIPTESLSSTDNLLATDSALPAEALTASDLTSALQSWPVDSLSASDSLLATDTDLPAEALTATESLIVGDGYSASESNTITDSVLSADSLSGSESLTISESLTSNDTLHPAEALTINESALATGAYAVSDTLSGSDVLSGTTTLLSTDMLTASDATLDTDSYFAEDDLTISDTFSTGAVATNNTMSSEDDLTASDVLLVMCGAQPTDSASIIESLLVSDGSSFVDALTISDTFTSASITTNMMTFEDDLSVADTALYALSSHLLESNTTSDLLSVVRSWPALDGLNAIESLSAQQIYGPLDVTSASDVLSAGGSATFAEVNTASDVLNLGGSYLPTENLSAVESLLATDSASWSDLLSASSAWTSMTNNPMLSTDSLVANDMLSATAQVAFVEYNSISSVLNEVELYIPPSNMIIYVRSGVALVEVRG
jgi:hypothetical protein